MPNPTTSKSNDLHQHERASPVEAAARMRLVAEGERLLASVAAPRPWRQSLTDDTMILTMDSREVAAIDGDYNSPDEWPTMEANAALIVFAVNNLPALLRAASENVSLREQVVSANEQRDAAEQLTEVRLREVGELREALLGAEKAVQAAFGQADAEFRDHDKRAAKHEATIREWRTQRDAALAPQAEAGEG